MPPGSAAATTRASIAEPRRARDRNEAARRAALLRSRARRGSAIEAQVVAAAEPGGTVLTADVGDRRALAAYAHGVAVESL